MSGMSGERAADECAAQRRSDTGRGCCRLSIACNCTLAHPLITLPHVCLSLTLSKRSKWMGMRGAEQQRQGKDGTFSAGRQRKLRLDLLARIVCFACLLACSCAHANDRLRAKPARASESLEQCGAVCCVLATASWKHKTCGCCLV